MSEKETEDSIYRREQHDLVHQMIDGHGNPSIMPIQSDFRSDPAICLSAISFLPKHLAERVHQMLIQPLRQLEPQHHYYLPSELHLTVKAVQVVSDPPTFGPDEEARVDGLFTQLLPDAEPMSFHLAETVRFPTSLALIAYASTSFGRLVRKLDQGLKHIGVPDNKRYVSDRVFFGNVSVCRFREPPSERFLHLAEETLFGIDFGMLELEDVCLLAMNGVCAEDSRRVINTYHLKHTS